MSSGIRHGGSSKFGLFNRASQHGGEEDGPQYEVGGAAEPYSGRHAGGAATARKRSRKIVPVAAVVATLAAGAAAYGLAGHGSPQAAQLGDVAQPVSLSNTTHVGTGSAEAAASATIGVVKTASGSVARLSARAQHSSSPRAGAKSSAMPATTKASVTPTAPASASSTSTPPASASAAPAATPSRSSAHTASTLSCNLSSAMLPDNVTAIVSFLLANGYSDNAAAGIAGNMYQESEGNPESEGMGGGGLIGFTPLPAGYVTGNVAADLQTQLSAVLTYNQQWASYLPALNSAATPADAADIYVTDFERAGIPAASNREASAEAVAEACGI